MQHLFLCDIHLVIVCESVKKVFFYSKVRSDVSHLSVMWFFPSGEIRQSSSAALMNLLSSFPPNPLRYPFFLPLFTLQAAFLIHVVLQCEVFSNLELLIKCQSPQFPICYPEYFTYCLVSFNREPRRNLAALEFKHKTCLLTFFFFFENYIISSFISICGNNSQEISTSYSVPGLQRNVVVLCWRCVTLVCIYRLLEQRQMAVLWSCDYRWQKAHLQLKSCWSHYQKVFRGSV